MPLALAAVAVLLGGCEKDAEEVHSDLVGHSHANTVVALSLSYSLEGTAFDTSRVITDVAGTKVKVTELKFYMSQPWFADDAGDTVAAFPNKYLLWKAAQPGLIQTVGEVDGHLHELNVGLGVDSTVNLSDPATMDAPLNDFSMYWPWASGRIFLLLDGKYDSNGDGQVTAVDNDFSFHCGRNNLYTPFTLNVHTDADMGGNVAIPLDLRIDSLFATTNVAAEPVPAQSGQAAQDMMHRLATAIIHAE